MMTAIFVFIKCELGHANDVAADMVDNVENVSEVYSTSGQYDLLAKFQLPKEMDIGTFVTKSVQTRASYPRHLHGDHLLALPADEISVSSLFAAWRMGRWRGAS